MAATKPFDFLAFARLIYRERRGAHPERFLLPALYGGESRRRFEALLVLEAPSVQFTVDRWKACRSAEQAVRCHREIFLNWADRGKQAHLFQALSENGLASATASHRVRSRASFFHRFYITDVWKDAGFGIPTRGRSYKDYWLSKLAIELRTVPARRVILVGGEAAVGARFVRPGTPIHYLPFPSQWITEQRFVDLVAELAKEIRGSRDKPSA